MDKTVRILVVNGSPKGEFSLTLQHSLYMLGRVKDVEWRVLQVGFDLTDRQIAPNWLEKALAELAWSDAVLWNTPVYTMLVPWQLMRFFQLVKDAGRNDVFAGKYATSMITCFHYYDHLAEKWLRAMSEDRGMAFIEGRTADNTDMLKHQHRISMRFFMDQFVHACRNKLPVERIYQTLPTVPSPRFSPKTPATDAKPKQKGLRTVLLTDEVHRDGNLSRMIDVFVDAYPHPVEIIDINAYPYEAACNGCLKCELVGDCCPKSANSWRVRTTLDVRIPSASSATNTKTPATWNSC